MQLLAVDDFLQLKQNAKVLEQDKYGEKVLLLTDGSILKLFRRKRTFTSAAFWPYAQRFADNATLLRQLGIPVPEVIKVARINEIERDIVHYQPLAGRTLRQLQKDSSNIPEDLFVRLAHFLAQLHKQGVLFRSIHLGNIILTPEQTLGLIDFADLKKQAFRLFNWQRQRNFRHMLRYPEDQAWLASNKYGDFSSTYKQLTGYPHCIL